MLLIDIDGTISPTRVEEAPASEGETARAMGFQVFIPKHLLEFLRSRDDVVLLSTWGVGCFSLIEAFKLKARVALIEDFSERGGIEGKFCAVKALQPTLWADDHIKPAMKKYAQEHGIITAVPRKGYITPAELKKLEKLLAEAPARSPREEDSKLLWSKP